MESFKQVETRSSKQKKFEFNSSRVSPIPSSTSQLGALNSSKYSNQIFASSKKFFSASVPDSRIVSRATSPTSRRPSPPRSTTPTPTLGGLTSPRIVVDDAKRTNERLSQEVTKLRAQVETLTQKAQLQEVELEGTSKQLKEAISIAGEETAKCKAEKEVIKSLTSQLKEMAERMPAAPGRNIKSPKSVSSESNITSSDIPNGCIDQVHSQLNFQELESSVSNNQLLSNGSSNASNRSAVHNRQGYPEVTTKNGARTKEFDSRNENEWVEQDEPGVYITLTSLPGGVKDLKRVRFSWKLFSKKQAEKWWAENRARVYELYNVRVVDKGSVGTASVDLAH
ncbi:Protein Brevis radix-like 1 [Capsicum baccatum]|uniref:Protein Brevis radix-like 1 n=1 Tax=Capsicum baccatum TaxID=33114 RepID=A0A2G2V7M9_CAPBA|nr:Protein Brevis radix-like 1 [Capsicum baccatum]